MKDELYMSTLVNILVFLPALWYNAGTGMICLNLYVSHPQKTAQICQIKLDEKRDSRRKALGLFCVLEGLRGEKQRSRDRGESLELVDVPGKYWWTKSGENKRI